MSTVPIRGETSLSNEDGFYSSPLPVVRDHLFHLGLFLINVVVRLNIVTMLLRPEQ